MVAYLLLIIGATYILFVEGFHVFALWNCVPAALGGFLVWWVCRRRHSPAVVGAVAGFVFSSMALSVAGHVAWQFDLGGTVSGSSTSPILFVFLPLYAGAIGVAGAVVGAVVGWRLRDRRAA